jgi:hypothetical protein
MEKPQAWGRNDKPPPQGDVLHVHRLKAEGQLTAVVLSDKMIGFNTHWDGRKTVRCCKPKFACGGCAQKWPGRWVGLIHCCTTDLTDQFIVEVTPSAGNTVYSEWEKKGSIRGAVIFLHRQRAHKRAPLVVHFKGYMEGLDALPKERCCEPTAVRLYAYAPSLTS